MTQTVAQDPERLAALYRLNLLDSLPDEAFDRLTRMAVALLDVRASYVAIVDEDREFYLSHAGFPADLATARETTGDSLSRRTIQGRAPLVLHDIRRQGEGQEVALVKLLDIVAYAGVPLALADGTVLGAFCVVDDRPREWTAKEVAVLREMASSITAEIELRATRRAAEQERNHHRNLLRDLGIVAWEMEAGTGRIIHVAQAAEAVFGYPVERWGREPDFWIQRVVHPGDRDRVRQRCAEAADGEPTGFDHRAVTADGRTLWVHTRVRAGRGGGAGASPPGLHGVVMDVSGQRRAEQALRESEERFRLMVEGSEQVIFYEHDDRGRFVYVSPSVRAVLGLEPDLLVGRPYTTLLLGHESDADVKRRTEGALASGLRSEPYTATVRAAGGEKVVEINERPLIRDGAVVGIQGFARDITQRLEAERKLAESEALFRQAQKMEAVGRLAGGVAHDFNNILTAIKGHVDLVLKSPDTAAEVREDIQQVARSADRAVSLTRQLLAFSRQQVLRPRVLDLNGIVAELEEMLGRLIGENIRLETHLQSDLAPIRMDPTQLQQVIMNLVVNARDAMPRGGRLVLRTTNATLTAPEVERFPYPVRPGPYALLTVSDSGEGMDEETLARVFEPFFTTKDAGKGTGLGLSTVYGIIKQSGGYIWTNSEPGQGTTFRIYLPRVTGEAAPVLTDAGALSASDGREEERVEDEATTGRATILVVEDEPSVRHLICKTLQRQGYRVMEATNGNEAMGTLELHPSGVDLVLTDVVMPDMGGAELGRAIEDGRTGARILYMSGYTEDDMVLERGGILRSEVAFLPKPFSTDELLRTVRSTLKGRTDPQDRPGS
ncbi:MAG TPA: PAS domain S-box protein [Longimicrobiales bacterium]|nr:PAS domain S-box protein [Longimicrobiales bacterium]